LRGLSVYVTVHVVDRGEIEQYLREVGGELASRGITGEIAIVGGAFMTLVVQAREATKDVDAYFDPSSAPAIREAAATVARSHGLPLDWLNDAVKGFFVTSPATTVWAEYPGLRVNAVTAAYMFAMKALAGRPQDAQDLRSLADALGIATAEAGLEVVRTYIPERLLTPRVRYLLEDLFEDADG
jgi:predicted nucleotidyltransferase